MPKRTSGINNEVIYSRESKAKEPFSLNKKSVAFTLAEVLITLAIIGVVAALTIPTVVAKYQQKMYYTQFMKSYNTIVNAFNLAQMENGDYDTWGAEWEQKELDTKIFNEKLAPYLKISKVCETSTDCGIDDNLWVSLLNVAEGQVDGYGDPIETKGKYKDFFTSEEEYYLNPILLSDGSILRIVLGGRLTITFDTNGIKGPNTLGRDIFTIESVKSKNNGPIILVGDEGAYTYDYTLEQIKEDCTTEQESEGWNCAQRLILEGKMNY